MKNEYEIFRLWIIIGVGLMSIFLILIVWRYYYFLRRNPKDGPTDYGLVYLTSGILVWSILAMLKLDSIPNGLNQFKLHFLSMLNNGLLLSSLPFFEYSRFTKSNLLLKKYWTVISLASAGIVLIIICTLNSAIVNDILDWGFSTVIFIILGGILFRSFYERGLSPVGYIAQAVMYMTIFSQFLIIFFPNGTEFSTAKIDINKIGHLTGGISFAMMLVLLVALAFSWILDENHVLDKWQLDQLAAEFWRKEDRKLEDKLKDLKKEAEIGLNNELFKKLTSFFRITPIVDKQVEEINKIELTIRVLSGSYSALIQEYQNGKISDAYYQSELNKIQKKVVESLEYLTGQ